jgi:hypothetical protein
VPHAYQRLLRVRSFGSLPQKPRTVDEEVTFKQALRIMADVYASPLGTCVLQLKDIPPRPVNFDDQFNDRKYDERGWCALMSAFITIPPQSSFA